MPWFHVDANDRLTFWEAGRPTVQPGVLIDACSKLNRHQTHTAVTCFPIYRPRQRWWIIVVPVESPRGKEHCGTYAFVWILSGVVVLPRPATPLRHSPFWTAAIGRRAVASRT